MDQLKIGAGLAAALIGYGMLFRAGGVRYDSPLSWGFYLMVPLAVWLALSAATPGSGLKGSLVGAGTVGAIGAAGYGVFVYLVNRFWDDSLLEDVRYDRIRAIEARNLTTDRLEPLLARTEALLQPLQFAVLITLQLVVLALIVGLVLGLVRR